jgi:hypothetical protein
MTNLEKASRRQRVFLPIAVFLFAASLTLFLWGYRGIAGWLVLTSSLANLMTAVAIRRTRRSLVNER